MNNILYDYMGGVVSKSPFSTPEMFGAVGDGTADDTVAVQTAISEQYVQFTSGKTYKVTSPLRFKKNTYLDMNNATILSTSKRVFFNFEDGDSYGGYNGNGNITIANGTVIGGSVAFAHGSGIRFENVHFQNCLNDHFMEICACTDYIVDKCSFVGMLNLDTSVLEYINIDTNAVYGAFPHNKAGQNDPVFYDGSVSDGIIVRDTYFSVGEGNYAYGFNAVGAHGRTISNTYTKNVTLLNNTIRGFTGCGIRVNAMDGILVGENDIQTVGDGIRIGDVADAKNIVIKGNYVACSGTRLVRTSGGYTNLTVANNVKQGDTQEF